jgi:hypothetical protein
LVRVLIKKKVESEETLGKYITCKEYADEIINEDTDLYAESIEGSISEANIIFKYRKNVFTKEECDAAYIGLRGAAIESQNRGMAAGPRNDKLQNRDWVTEYHHDILDYFLRPDNILIDDESPETIRKHYQSCIKKEEVRGHVWLRNKILERYVDYHDWFDKWVDGLHNLSREEQRREAQHIVDNFISDTNYANPVISGIAGYFDRYPRIPYGRATSYTEKNWDKFILCFPYLKKLNEQFKTLLPERYKKQREAADKLDNRFLISSTVFTTLTVNHNWRTACHRDAGDLHEGFSNICGVTGPEGKGWKGGQFILPEYRIALNIQPGDMLLVNNHAGIHGNDELIGDDNDRMTIVAYFREKMVDLKSCEYENLRRKYVDERRLNEKHILWRKGWNGVSPDMWDQAEWYDYMKKHNIENPYPIKEQTSLENFF